MMCSSTVLSVITAWSLSTSEWVTISKEQDCRGDYHLYSFTEHQEYNLVSVYNDRKIYFVEKDLKHGK